MNKVILMGRLTRNPEVRYSAGDSSMAIARYTLAVDRRFTRRGEDNNGATAHFIPCVAFGRSAEFAEKYFHQGMKVVVTGRIQTGSYVNKDGQKVYSVQIIVEEIEFAESKNAAVANGAAPAYQAGSPPAPGPVTEDGFMRIPDGAEADLPFN